MNGMEILWKLALPNFPNKSKNKIQIIFPIQIFRNNFKMI